MKRVKLDSLFPVGNSTIIVAFVILGESTVIISLVKIRIDFYSFVIIHDDADLPLGRTKVVQERGSAGHKGVESVIRGIGKKGLVRMRIGIGSVRKIGAEKLVLEKFLPDELKVINKVLQKTADALAILVKEGLDKAMNEYNKQ